MTCHAWSEPITKNAKRIMLHQIPSSQPMAYSSKSLHLIEELGQYTTPGYFLHHCGFDQLVDLAKRTYCAFGSTNSAHMALSRDEKYSMEYFNQFLDPSVDASFCQSNVVQVCDDTLAAPRPDDEPGGPDGMDGDNDREDNSMGIAHLADIDIEFGEDHPRLALEEQTCRDVLMHNNAPWHNLLHYWELKHSAK